MAAVTWVKIESWHVLKFDDPASTACGREVDEDDEVLDDLPSDWYETRSCETCLRVKEAQAGRHRAEEAFAARQESAQS